MEQEAGSREQEAGSRKQGAGSREQEAGSGKQEAGSGKQEAGSREQEEITPPGFTATRGALNSSIPQFLNFNLIQHWFYLCARNIEK